MQTTIIAGLISFSALFGYNPVAWLCLFILIAGILGSARIVLGHHSLGEVLFGFIIGFLCAFVIADSNNFFTRLEAYLGLYVTIASASATFLPRIASNTKQAF